MTALLRILGTFIVHRSLLVAVAFLAVRMAPVTDDPTPNYGDNMISVLSTAVDSSEEGMELKRALGLSTFEMLKTVKNPFLWICAWVSEWTKLSPAAALIIVSNLFFLFFLRESLALATRMVSTELAVAIGTYLILWPSSYELSLGSSFVFTCYLATTALRAGLDGLWILAAILSGLLFWMDPLSIGVLASLLYVFWYFQRHEPRVYFIKSLAFLLVPITVALFVNRGEILNWAQTLPKEAITQLMGFLTKTDMMGQTGTLVFLLFSTILGVVVGSTGVHRLLTVLQFATLIFFSDIRNLGSRAPFAVLCFQGIAIAPRVMARVLFFFLCSLGLWEFYRLLS